MESLIFDTGIDIFARKYLVKGNEHLDENPYNFVIEYTKIINKIAENLLLHDGIAIKTYGENIPLAMLINTLGLKGVEALIDQGAIEFVLGTPTVTYLVDSIPGVMPLQSGMFTSKAHCDPEVSVELGLGWLKNPLPRRDRRNLIRKVSKLYKLPDKKLAENALDFGYDGYNKGLFNELGLPKTKELIELNQKERAKLCDLTTQSLELSIISKYKYSTSNLLQLSKLTESEMGMLKDANKIEEFTNSLFTIEKLPNFAEMIKAGVIDIKKVPKLRSSKNGIKFRKWIGEISESCDKEEIAKEYIDNIVNKRGFLETNKGKFLKNLGVTTFSGIVGSNIGAAVAGPIGGAVGGPIGVTVGVVASQIASIGISLFDEYMLDSITKGWTPRYYFDKDIRPLLRNRE